GLQLVRSGSVLGLCTRLAVVRPRTALYGCRRQDGRVRPRSVSAAAARRNPRELLAYRCSDRVGRWGRWLFLGAVRSAAQPAQLHGRYGLDRRKNRPAAPLLDGAGIARLHSLGLDK